MISSGKPDAGADVFVRRRNGWTLAEDEVLEAVVRTQGPQNWLLVSQKVGGKAPNQCRDRWHNYLSPLVNKGPWTEQEKWRLFLLHRLFGNRWALIAEHLISRTDNSVKNIWNSSLRACLPDMTTRLENAFDNLTTDPLFLEQELHPIDLKLVELIAAKEKEMPLESEPLAKLRRSSAKKKISKTPKPTNTQMPSKAQVSIERLLSEESETVVSSLTLRADVDTYTGQVYNNINNTTVLSAAICEGTKGSVDDKSLNSADPITIDPKDIHETETQLKTIDSSREEGVPHFSFMKGPVGKERLV